MQPGPWHLSSVQVRHEREATLKTVQTLERQGVYTHATLAEGRSGALSCKPDNYLYISVDTTPVKWTLSQIE